MQLFARLQARFWAVGLVLLSAPVAGAAEPIDRWAERYVKLVLAIGEHAEDYVDAYYGPPEWREASRAAGRRPLDELVREADEVRAGVEALRQAGAAGQDAERCAFLGGQLASASAYLRLLQGEKSSFDEEALALYGITPPHEPLASFEAIQSRLEHLIPGEGDIVPRYLAWRAQFAVPLEKLEGLVQTAIAEARRRTRAEVELPAREAFTLSLVTDKPWGAYNWYQGGARSLIEVNTSLPVYLSQVLHYAVHEGYPGHHVYNLLQEETLARAQGRVEHTVLPLFSPLALIAEGSAEAGVSVAFRPEERLAFERDVLFPQAGLPVEQAATYAEVRELVKDLSRARVQLARAYLDGAMSAAEVEAWLVRHGLQRPEEARRSIRFFDTYRSYIVNYTVGEQVVLEWLDARAGRDPGARWDALIDLLRSSRLPADLLARPAR